MGDTEMIEQDVAVDLVDETIQLQESSGPAKEDNPNADMGSPQPGDVTRTLASDVHLSDAAEFEVADDAENYKGEVRNAVNGNAEVTNAVNGNAEVTNAGNGNADVTNAGNGKAEVIGAAHGDEEVIDAAHGDEEVIDASHRDEEVTDAMNGDVKAIDASSDTKVIDATKAIGAESVELKASSAKNGDAKAFVAVNGVPEDIAAEDTDIGTSDARVDEMLENTSNVNDTPRSMELAAAFPPHKGDTSTPKTEVENGSKWKTWLLSDNEMGEVDESGTPEERAAFMKDLDSFHKEHGLEFKPPKFYGEPLNCLKLWRAVVRLGGYELVTGSKLWRQVGESFHPPKTCTTVSWTFRIFYEKALLEYEKHFKQSGQITLPGSSVLQVSSVEKEVGSHQGSGSGRARRDSAARAMQGWHTQRLLGSGEVTEPIIKEKSLNSTPRREKPLKSIGLPKQRTPNSGYLEKAAHETDNQSVVAEVVDVGIPADWVKVNVRETKDCFEVYALVPGLLREEVRVQSDPAGRLVITGEPEKLDNPWGITPFTKVVNLPARIDPFQTSAVVSLHGRLFVRVPFEQASG